MNLSFFIARRYLVKQKGTFSSFIIRLAIVATALSVAVMIVAMAIISGFQYTIRQKMYSLQGHIHIELYNANRSQSLTLDPIKWDPALVSTLQHMQHVKQVSAFAARPTIVQFHGQMEGVLLKGMKSDYHYSKDISFTGKPLDYSDTAYSKDILLSENTADKLNVTAGDTVHLYFLEGGAKFPRIRKVRVAGLFHTGMGEMDNYFGLGDIRLIQRVNNWQPEQISGYQMELDNEKYADTIANTIFEKYLQAPMTSYTMRDIYSGVFDWLGTQDVTGLIMLVIMSVIAIINLASSLMILIVEQSRMVGLLKALGMGLQKMQGIFLYHAGIIAGIGILLGNVLALGLCWLQLKTGFMTLSEETYYMKQVPVRINWWQVVMVDAGTLVLCLLCMWLPTLYIRRVRPAQVLQFK